MAMSITDYIKKYYKGFQLLKRSFAMITPVPLKETHAMYRKDDLVKIILIYF
jgi:hypothetical protein